MCLPRPFKIYRYHWTSLYILRCFCYGCDVVCVAVKDGALGMQSIRTEEIELVDDDDGPPPVPDTPRRIQFDRNYDKHSSIAEEDDNCNNSSFKSNLFIFL